ncbi:MAG: isoprenylcysteine carboxylmethyltransferase family protein [Dokdonella sp.]|nr:MAG: isoprenylcysteine carboxylmethyltransferase family protein [Gammaproteobacteria bacterium]TXI74429.1 MAG: isoprenylcysteine carboxylmethyltransferase family protein [Dokdonella sp.]
MKVLENRIPPPLAGLVCGFLMWLLARFTPIIALPGSLRLILAVMFGVLGFAIAIAGVVAFRRSRTTVNPLKPETASELVTDGVYRFTRNPMYLGMALVLIGWAVFLSTPASLLGVVLFMAFIDRFQIRPEERAMRGLFGEAFSAYASRVRRWL